MAFLTLKKITSLGVILCFFISNTATANPLLVESFPQDSLILNISLPKKLGTIQETSIPKAHQDKPFIFHLQTAHAHYQSSQRIREIILYLNKHYNAKLIFAEGASEALRPEYLRFFPGSNQNKALLDTLAQKGIATGVDLALIEKGLRGFGVENPHFYQSAFRVFKKVMKQKEKDLIGTEKQKRILETQISKTFSPGMNKIFKVWKKFKTNPNELKRTLNFLKAEAKELLRLDLTEPLSQFEWPFLTRLVLIGEIEKKMDAEALEKERREMRRRFGPIPDPETRQDYKDFLDEVIPAGYQFIDYPQFTYYAALKILEQEMKASPSLKELERLFERLFEETQSNPEEKKLLEKYRKVLLIEKLLHLELTREEWNKVSAFPLHAQREAEATARSFYKLTEKREQAFFKKIQETLQSEKEKIAILVTGGFHTSGLSEQFKKKDIGYAVILPTLSEDLNSHLYHKVMLGQAHMEHPELAHPPFLGDKAYYRAEARIVERVYKEFLQKQSRESRLQRIMELPYFLSRSESRSDNKKETLEALILRLRKGSDVKVGLSFEEILVQTLMQSPDYDWEKNINGVPSLKGSEFDLNPVRDGAFKFSILSDYKNYSWGIRGTRGDLQSRGKVISQTVENGFLKITVELTGKEKNKDVEPMTRVFYIGRYTRELPLKDKSEQEPLKALEIFDINPAQRVLGEMVEQPVDYDWTKAREDFPSLKGFSLGKVNGQGRITLYTSLKPHYRLVIPDIDYEKWEGADVTIVKEVYRPNFYQFKVELRLAESGERHQETFQIGHMIRRAKDGELDKNNHLLVSHELGLHIIGTLVMMSPKIFEGKMETGLIPDLTGLRVGKIKSNGGLSFNPVPRFRYPWSIFGSPEGINEGVIRRSEPKGVVLEFDIDFDSSETNEIEKVTFQMSPDFTKKIPGQTTRKGETKDALEISTHLLALAFKKIVNHPPGKPFDESSDLPRTKHLLLGTTNDEGQVKFVPDELFYAYSLSPSGSFGKNSGKKARVGCSRQCKLVGGRSFEYSGFGKKRKSNRD